ncbi:MAG: Ig-like domain-containing protein [Anaerolineae bacterium]|nr:Ig-like domain-containing protein [Anaerolineae bacterium]
MRRAFWLLLVGALALSGLLALPSVRSAADNITPQIIESEPARGQELATDGSVTFYFNVPMDHATVEAAFGITPNVRGRFTWADDLTVTYTPDVPLERAAGYVFTMSDSARSVEGMQLKAPFRLSLQTVGFLEVVQIIPADGATEIGSVPTITVIFNRPVVPLLPLEEMKALPSPIIIQPAVEGTGEWISTSIYQFKPKQLKGGSDFVVTVPKGLKDVTGSILREDVSAKFSTIRPMVIDASHNRSRYVLRDPHISIVFNQAMDRAATEAAFRLSPDSDPNRAIPGKFEWNDRSTRFTFTPDVLLDYDTLYVYSITTDAISETGAPLNSTTRVTFTTLGLPTVTSVYPPDLSEGVQASGFSLDFNAPMNVKDFEKRIVIEPEPQLKFENYGSDYNFIFGFSHEPSTAYTATVDVAGLTDIYGTPVIVSERNGLYRVIDGKVVVQWTTAAYPPEANLRVGGSIGLYSAYNASTRLFSTHRNIEQINLALSQMPMSEMLKVAVRPWYRPTHDQITPLRTWTYKVENPLNVLRYDMLTISDQGQSYPPAVIQCEGAPRARLRIDDVGIVLPEDPTPLNVRERPRRDAQRTNQLPINTQFRVTNGPVCSDGFVWYQIQVGTGNSRINGWVAEGTLKGYFIGKIGSTAVVPPTEPQRYDDLAETKPALKPGGYLISMDSPEITYSRRLEHVMVVATANIVIKQSVYDMTAWVTDLQSGTPIPGVEVQFYRLNEVRVNRTTDLQVEILGSATTNEDGLAVYTFPERLEDIYADLGAVVNTGEVLGIGSLNWDSGISPWDFDQNVNYNPRDETVYLYTDRSLYRPGQPVYFRGVLRDRKDMRYTLSRTDFVAVEVLDGRNQVIFEKEIPVTPYGTFSDSFTIDENAPLGYYRIVVRPGFRGNKDTYTGSVYSRGINVAQYRVPEYQVSVTAAQPEAIQGETLNVTVESSYFFGGALSNARVEYSVFSEDYYFNYQGKGRYNFIDFNEDEGYSESYQPFGEEIASGTGRTDAAGKFTIELPASLGKAVRSQRYTIEARVIDESDQLIAGRATVIVHQGEFYLGAGPEEYIGTAGKAQKVNLISVKPDSTPRPNTSVAVTVVERVWRSVQTVEPATGRTVWNYDVEEKPVSDGEIMTDAEGKAVFEFTPERGGIYKVYVSSRDDRGNNIKSSTFLWVAGPGYVPWRQQNSNRIDLKIDRDSYKVGDEASILIASPFQGETTALVTVERGTILKTEVIRMPNNSYVYKLPITPDLAPNAYVSVVLVKGVDENNPVAAFRVGLIQLSVETERLKLNIQITPDKERAGPRETVNYKIKVTDYNGEPVQAEVGVGLTDLAVLSLMPDTSTPILSYFYSKQGLSIRTSSSLVISVDQQTQEILNTVKGGGGGGPEGGIFEVRQKFIDTPLWQPSVVTDANGEATISVELPDQLTTWRLDVRAVTLAIGDTQTTLVGQNTFDLLSTKPLLIRPITPRFYVVGDKGTLVAIVNNNSGADQEVTVSAEITGATPLEGTERKATVPNGGRQRFEFPIEVLDSEAVGVTFFARNADATFTDAAKSAVGQGDDKTLPVNRYEVPETVGTGGWLATDELARTEGILLPKRYNVTEGTLSLRLDRSLAASAVDALEVLKYYPHYCTEQTVSRFLPNLATYGAFTKLGVEDPKLRAEVEEALSLAIQRLYNDQKSDGGWGWFKADKSNPLVTAYTLIGLAEARSQGFQIDDLVTENAIRFLQEEVFKISTGFTTPAWQLNRLSFILYALARADAGSFSKSIQLYEVREKMDLYGRAYLAMNLNLIDPQSKTYTDTLLSDIVSRAAVSATGIFWSESYSDYYNWNTDTRTTAIILKMMIQIDPQNKLIPNVVRYLMVARKADAWETTQETAWAVMALVDWMSYTGELRPSYAFGVSMNGKALVQDETATPENVRESVKLAVDVKDLLKGEVNRMLVSRTAGDGMLYYTAHLRVKLPVEMITPAERGISIERTYTIEGDPNRTPVTEAVVGQNIRVTLTIVLPNDLHYVVITDPIPAGTESINPSLATSAIGERPTLRLDDPLDRGWGWWWFSSTELRDDRTVLYATYLPRGTYKYTYLIRAGLAGEYRVIPPTGEAFYTPEIYGRGAGTLFTIKPNAGE